MKYNIASCVTLNNKKSIHRLGLGTLQTVDMSEINAMDENCSIMPASWEPETSEQWR